MQRRSNVNESSVAGLKAELHAARQRAQGLVPPGSKRLRTDKLQLADRPRRDAESTARFDDRAAASRAKLERKAHLYTKLQQGKGAGFDSEGLVDWDLKDREPSPEADDDQLHREDQGSAASLADEEHAEDPLVEFTDELGRTRMIRKSDLPRVPSPDSEEEQEAIYGPASSFPVYHRDPRMLEVLPPRPVSPEAEHFNADWEIRNRGAAFYKFDADESKRRAQQRDLDTLRQETQSRRAEHSIPTQSSHRTTLGSERRAERQRLVDARRAAVQ
ncbi:hypothetical protein MYAM1_002941 [Malassezia yamatoensis]|uniref:CCDC174 alpha/beta GRSR domain-containing protein n=1 Tax=Malassezia yamatoensis TaxID=253288 RepID=A0AAJ5YVT2_9BASI|nr:hypothetical protein MYAM1_002941 [Malassezia yamatoensis]